MRTAAVARARLHGPCLRSDRGSDWNFVAETLFQGGLGQVPEYLFFVRNHPGAFSSPPNRGGTSKTERLQWFSPGRRMPAFMSPAQSLYSLVEAVLEHHLPARERLLCLRHIAARLGGRSARRLRPSGAAGAAG
jgi:hypothetical protein